MRAILKQLYLAALLFGAFMGLSCTFFVGCHSVPVNPSSNPAHAGTPELSRDVAQAHLNLNAARDAFTAWLKSAPELTPDVRALVSGRFAPVSLAIDAETKPIKAVENSSVADSQRETKLREDLAAAKAHDSATLWFNIIGVGIVALGIAVVVLSFFQAWAIPFRGYAIAATIVGFTLLTMARYLHAIELTILWTAVAAVVCVIVVEGYRMWKNGGLVPGFMALVPTPPKSLTVASPAPSPLDPKP